MITSCDKSVLPPPVRVKYRDSLFDSGGKVMQITNKSSHHLYNVRVVGRNFKKFTSASVKATDHLRPGATVEVGWFEFEDWTPISGETMEVYADNYLTPHISVIP
jgi:acyl-CoA-binding protein